MSGEDPTTRSAVASWGFDTLTVASVHGFDIPTFFERLNDGARSRGIDPAVPSDALDMSRDLIVTEALGPHDRWEIVDGHLVIWDGRYGRPEDIAVEGTDG